MLKDIAKSTPTIAAMEVCALKYLLIMLSKEPKKCKTFSEYSLGMCKARFFFIFSKSSNISTRQSATIKMPKNHTSTLPTPENTPTALGKTFAKMLCKILSKSIFWSLFKIGSKSFSSHIYCIFPKSSWGKYFIKVSFQALSFAYFCNNPPKFTPCSIIIGTNINAAPMQTTSTISKTKMAATHLYLVFFCKIFTSGFKI